MSDAEDTAAVPTTPETVTESVPDNDAPTPKNLSINEPPPEIPTELIKPPSNVLSKHETTGVPESSDDHGKVPKEDKKQDKKSGKKSQPCPPPQSRCRARSRDMRQCKKHYREMIGKHEIRNDELEQRETDLRQRLEMLECSMPAVMVWNIWRMAQGAPVSHLREIVEKQLEPGAFSTCPSRPSQHWDCRVREVEAERKQALHRAEEAREVFAAKEDALKLQRQQIEEARKLQEERRLQIARLEDEVKRLQDALKRAQGDENSCETGECGEIQCRQMWLQGVSSVSSIHSTDLECLARLQDLAEAELCMKRQIADLERRECAYMRTLQQADEMWAKMEDDNASNLGDMKEQLDAKIAANQQLADRIVELEDEIEKLRTQLNKALATLDEHQSKTFADTRIGDANVSTEEKIQQTRDDVEEREDGITEEIKPPKQEAIEYTATDESEQSQLKVPKTEDQPSIADTSKQDIEEPKVVDEEPHHQQIQVETVISTTEESVQVKPVSQEAEVQSMIRKPDLQKETSTEDRIQVEATTITEIVGGESVSGTGTISSERAETKHVDEPLTSADGSRPFEDKASLAHLLKAPTEDKDTGVMKTENDSADKKKAFQTPPAASAEPIPQTATEKGSEASVKTTSELVEVVVPETTSELARKPVAKVSFQTGSEPDTEDRGVTLSGKAIDAAPKPIGQAAISSPKPPKEAHPRLINEVESKVLPISAIEDTSGPVGEPESHPAVDASSIPALKPTVKTVERTVLAPVTQPTVDTAPIPANPPAVKTVEGPVLEPTPGVTKPEQIKLPANVLTVPIETLLSWHKIAFCLEKQISTCPQCSSASGGVLQMLEEIRNHLGEDAPDLDRIECTTVREKAQKSVTLPTKKGSCICKPKTCPLDGTPAAIPAHTNVKIQTVVDGESQTSVPVKIPSRDARGQRSSKGSTKNREEVKLMRIEEGTEPEPRMSRAKSIPQVKDETTVTVGDIGSQTETVRKVPSASKEKEKSCVCPTGVCPNKQTKPQSEECASGKISLHPNKPIFKEYKSTAEAILAPAIKIRPSSERASCPPVRDAKTDDPNLDSSSLACCVCGKPLTPVPSRKTTSIPVPSKSVFKSKAVLGADHSENDFLCCSCKAKDSNSSPSKSFGRSQEMSKRSHGVKPGSGTAKTSCSREICCPCDNQEVHVLTKPLTTDFEMSKTKTKPETKDVCCLAKISRDKVLKAEARRRKELTESTTPSVSSAGQMSASSSTYKGSRTTDSSASNVCCSSIEQVIDMTKKIGKGKKCACDGQDGKAAGKKEKCVCGENDEPKVPEHGKHIERSTSCSCPPKLFDKS